MGQILHVSVRTTAAVRRATEAATLREHAKRIQVLGRDLVVLGDFNDGPEAATTQILFGPPGNQPRGRDDATAAAGAFQRHDADDGRRLFNVTKLVPEEFQWSRKHNDQNELLDHIPASEGLMPRVNGLRQVPALSILNEDTPNMIGPHPTVGGAVPTTLQRRRHSSRVIVQVCRSSSQLSTQLPKWIDEENRISSLLIASCQTNN